MATFYVANTGNDTTGTGAIGAPWATLLRAINTVAVNDIIEIREGTAPLTGSFFKNGRDAVTIQNYPGEDAIVQSSGASSTMVFQNCRGIVIRDNPVGGSFTLRHSPTPVVPSAGAFVGAQLAPAPGGKNISGIESQLVLTGSPAPPNPFGLTTNSLPSVTVDGLIITDMRGKCTFGNGIGVIVRNCDLSHGSAGLLIDGTGANYACNGILFEDNDVHDMDKLWQDYRYPPTGTGEGDDAGGMGVHINRVSTGGIIRRNRFWNNTCYSSRYTRDGECFSPFRAQRWQFYENECWDNEALVETGTASGYSNLIGGEIHHNYFHGDINTNNIGPAMLIRTGNGTKIYNNTFVMDGGGRNAGGGGVTPKWILAIWPQGGGFGDNVTNLDIRNNIIVNTGSQNSPGNVLITIANNPGGANNPAVFSNFDYNLFYTPFGNVTIIEYPGTNYTQAQLANWRANTAWGDNDIWNVNPQLDSLGRPTPSSPAVDAGVAITGFTGPAPDIGYYDTSPTQQPVTYIDDTFTRSTTAGWGVTDNGLTYATAGGVQADYNVDGDEGTMLAAVAPAIHEARLLAVSALNITGSGRVRIDKVPTGTGGVTIYLNTRRVQSPLTCYRFKVRFLVGGGLRMSVSRNDQGGAETTPAGGTQVTPTAQTTFSAGQWIAYRYECWNETPGVASLRMRVWADGGTEPSTWDINFTDSTTGPLQTAGHVSRTVYVDATVANGPILFSFDSTLDTDPVAIIPPETYHGTMAATARAFMAVTGRKHDHGTISITQAARMLVTGTLRYPAPPGRQSPPYLLPEALAGVPVGTWNQTDPDAVDDDPDDPDAGDYVGLTKGASGEIAWSFAAPGWTLDTTTDGQTFEVAMRNPSAVSQDFRVLLMELVAGVWTVKKTGATQSLAGGASVMYLFTWTRSDLTDATGSNVACKVELL